MLHSQGLSNNSYPEPNPSISSFWYLFKVHSNIVLPSTPRPPQRSLSFRLTKNTASTLLNEKDQVFLAESYEHDCYLKDDGFKTTENNMSKTESVDSPASTVSCIRIFRFSCTPLFIYITKYTICLHIYSQVWNNLHLELPGPVRLTSTSFRKIHHNNNFP